jgi:hypothetical protein
MSYNIFLGLMTYSAFLTFSICTMYIYLFFLLSALSGGLTWGIKYSDYGSGGHPKGLDDFQVISLLVTCGVYVVLFFFTGRALRRFRTTGGITGLDPTDNLWEDKLFRCCACCFNAAAKTAGNHLDKEDAKKV